MMMGVQTAWSRHMSWRQLGLQLYCSLSPSIRIQVVLTLVIQQIRFCPACILKNLNYFSLYCTLTFFY
jgi:hypothetical protein